MYNDTRFLLLFVALVAFAPRVGLAQSGRDYVYIVGSSTVYPFATVIAERFGRASSFRTPKVESTGSGGGFRLFCDGIGADYPDISNSSRAIKASELSACAQNGVTEVVEVKIGYDGIVFANALSASDVALTRRDIYLALARDVPGDVPGELIANPYQRWSEVRSGLPDQRIEVLGPPPTSGTRDEFVELAMADGCRQFDWVRELAAAEPERYRRICHTLRDDGAFVQTGENDNLIVQKLEANPRAFGIFGFSFLDQNLDKVKAATIDGVPPTFDAIADGRYPISRPLYFYIKKAHVGMIPGLERFLVELTHERTLGEEGYLVDRGLIPLPAAERESGEAAVSALEVLPLAGK